MNPFECFFTVSFKPGGQVIKCNPAMTKNPKTVQHPRLGYPAVRVFIVIIDHARKGLSLNPKYPHHVPPAVTGAHGEPDTIKDSVQQLFSGGIVGLKAGSSFPIVAALLSIRGWRSPYLTRLRQNTSHLGGYKKSDGGRPKPGTVTLVPWRTIEESMGDERKEESPHAAPPPPRLWSTCLGGGGC